ncbi:surface antigen-like protein [Leptomonas seymouri]|uniref:Surface antigen-like protein n=1 Tax=Leptomonas seymouri TaxID=5684 RepID=A0A0N0P219_LEPSE|nr:surface antigen-like protein [Leptomonas seymouri]|eukprot:KPI82436.1 surface antigen-like protein [Leptomonas seymouri]
MYCASGYYVLNGQCAPASTCYVANCAQCMLRDGTKCSTCRNGYLLSSTYTCLSQHINVNGATAPHSPWVAAAVLLASAITYLV